ncbi:hypothetical protein LTS17_005965 [Exophiala oligosperma]
MKTSQVFRISAQTKGATFTSRISHGISKPFRAPPSPKWDGKIMKKVAAAAKSSFHRVPLSNSPRNIVVDAFADPGLQKDNQTIPTPGLGALPRGIPSGRVCTERAGSQN